MNLIFPRHKCGLHLTHNAHRDLYQSIQDYCREDDNWISDEQKTKALATDEMWVLQWYPDTPIGFHVLWAAELEPLLAAAVEYDKPDGVTP